MKNFIKYNLGFIILFIFTALCTAILYKQFYDFEKYLTKSIYIVMESDQQKELNCINNEE